ncbi:MAG: hypothetical protein DMD46_17030 [Gemmatimonadetes bacterium]|nr:MAG: hypothetical protein DMD46_17030 [Gemmatimonadota bacterium]
MRIGAHAITARQSFAFGWRAIGRRTIGERRSIGDGRPIDHTRAFGEQADHFFVAGRTIER